MHFHKPSSPRILKEKWKHLLEDPIVGSYVDQTLDALFHSARGSNAGVPSVDFELLRFPGSHPLLDRCDADFDTWHQTPFEKPTTPSNCPAPQRARCYSPDPALVSPAFRAFGGYSMGPRPKPLPSTLCGFEVEKCLKGCTLHSIDNEPWFHLQALNWTALWHQEAQRDEFPRITLTLHASVSLLPRINLLVQHWQGPVSLAVFIRNAQDHRKLHQFWGQNPNLQTWVDLHLLFRNTKFHMGAIPGERRMVMDYPVSLLRNIASWSVRTEFVSHFDVDSFPSASEQILRQQLFFLSLKPCSFLIALWIGFPLQPLIHGHPRTPTVPQTPSKLLLHPRKQKQLALVNTKSPIIIHNSINRFRYLYPFRRSIRLCNFLQRDTQLFRSNHQH
jgi:hypothetical protein